MANEKVNKVVLGNETLIDISADTVTADKLASGYTAHDASGEQITGSGTLIDATQITATQSNLEYGKTTYTKTDKTVQYATIFKDMNNLVLQDDALNPIRFVLNSIEVSNGFYYKNRATTITIEKGIGSLAEHFDSYVSLSIPIQYVDEELVNLLWGTSTKTYDIGTQSSSSSAPRFDYTYAIEDSWYCPELNNSDDKNLFYSFSHTYKLSFIRLSYSNDVLSSCELCIYNKDMTFSEESSVTYQFLLSTFRLLKTDDVDSQIGYYKPLSYMGRKIKNFYFLDTDAPVGAKSTRYLQINLGNADNRTNSGFFRMLGMCFDSWQIQVGGEAHTLTLPFGTLVSTPTGSKTSSHVFTPASRYGTTTASFTVTITVADEILYMWAIPLDSFSCLLFYCYRNASSLDGKVNSYSKTFTRMVTVNGGSAVVSSEISWGTARTSANTTAVSGSFYGTESIIHRIGYDNNQLGVEWDVHNAIFNSTGTTSKKNYLYYNVLRRQGNASGSYGLRTTAWSTCVNGTDTITTYGSYSYQPLQWFGTRYSNQTTSANYAQYVCTSPYNALYGAPVTTNVTSVAVDGANGFVGMNYYEIEHVSKIKEGLFIAVCKYGTETDTVINRFYLFNWDEINRVARNVRKYDYLDYDDSLKIERKRVRFSIVQDDAYLPSNMSISYVATKNVIIVDNILYRSYMIRRRAGYKGGIQYQIFKYVVFGYNLAEIDDHINDEGTDIRLSPIGWVYMDTNPVKTVDDTTPKIFSVSDFYRSDMYIDPFDGYAFEFETDEE